VLGNRNAEIINDIENNVDEEDKRMRPRRNAPMPARYIQRVYSVENSDIINMCFRDDFQEVDGFGADEVRLEVEDVESGDERKWNKWRRRGVPLWLPGYTCQYLAR